MIDEEEERKSMQSRNRVIQVSKSYTSSIRRNINFSHLT